MGFELTQCREGGVCSVSAKGIFRRICLKERTILLHLLVSRAPAAEEWEVGPQLRQNVAEYEVQPEIEHRFTSLRFSWEEVAVPAQQDQESDVLVKFAGHSDG